MQLSELQELFEGPAQEIDEVWEEEEAEEEQD